MNGYEGGFSSPVTILQIRNTSLFLGSIERGAANGRKDFNMIGKQNL